MLVGRPGGGSIGLSSPPPVFSKHFPTLVTVNSPSSLSYTQHCCWLHQLYTHILIICSKNCLGLILHHYRYFDTRINAVLSYILTIVFCSGFLTWLHLIVTLLPNIQIGCVYVFLQFHIFFLLHNTHSQLFIGVVVIHCNVGPLTILSYMQQYLLCQTILIFSVSGYVLIL